MIYRARHVTTYHYADMVQVSHHMAHLTPRNTPHQICERSKLVIRPEPDSAPETGTDYFGNMVSWFALQESHRKLVVEAESVVAVLPRDLPKPEETVPWEEARDRLAGPQPEVIEPFEFLFESPLVPFNAEAADYAAESFKPGRPLLEAALDLTGRIFRDFTYDPAATTIATPIAEVMRQKRGVCQDFAHLQISCLRSLGLAARYVSGYLLTHPPPGKEKLVGADASHAWLSLYVPDHGWIDLDPTNDVIPGIEHITVAWGRDFEDVSPIRGVVFGGGDHSLKVSVDIAPLPAARPVG